MQVYQTPKIVHQGVDTLVLNYKIVDIRDYIEIFKPKLDLLEELKAEAQKANNDFGAKFIKSDLDLGLGKFLVSSKGNRQYRFYIENEDMICFISIATPDKNLPNLQVHLRAKYLFKVGVGKAVKTANLLAKKLLGNKTVKQVARIDLATDLWGVRYDKLDGLRFQTIMGQKEFVETAEIKEFGRFYRVQGFVFGAGSKLFRIYDKSQKIKLSPSEAYIVHKWVYNGYDETKNIPVFRHEFQIRRDELKKIIPKNVNEISWVLKNLGSIWKYGLGFLEFVPLTDKEVVKVANGMTSEARKKMFQRVKQSNRYNFWHILDTWENQKYQSPKKRKIVNAPEIKTAEKYLKAFISSVYKVNGGNPVDLVWVLNSLNEKLEKYEGVNLHEYALSKLASSFVDYQDYVLKEGVNPEFDYSLIVNEAMLEFKRMLLSVNNKNYIKPVQKAVELIGA